MTDLNSDLGENAPDRIVSDDEAMLDVVTSANVSCGAHAGTRDGIRATLAAAARRGVAVGAHPGYRDLEGFGRRSLDADAGVLQADLEGQLVDLSRMAAAAGTRVRYVKPHGALYNDAVADTSRARTVVAAIRAVDPNLPVLGLPGSALLDAARRAGLGTATEAFADRGYLASGALVPRGEPGAVLHGADDMAQRMARLVRDGEVTAVDGTVLRLRADSICVHGDSPGAVTMAAAVRRALEAEGIPLAPFAP